MKKSRFGGAFPDQLAKVSTPYGHFHKHKDSEGWHDLFLTNSALTLPTSHISIWRITFLLIFCAISIFALFIRFFHLQIVQGTEFKELADSNRVLIELIHAPRGVIYDRNGKILAQNEPGFRLLKSTDSSNKKFHYISRDDALKLEIKDDPKFSKLEIDNLRAYPLNEKSAHILGYMGQVTQEELETPRFENYTAGDRVGRSGIEEVYEKFLRGVDGGEVIEVDSKGNKIRTLRRKSPIPGQNLYLSIDSTLQDHTYKVLEAEIKKSESCCGAAIVSDPQSGEILALVSIPSFNPSNIETALIDPSSPLLNRVIGGVYPPGSTFKIASSLAGLDSGKITKETQFEDTGVVSLGTFKFANWYFTQYGKTEGAVDIVKALKRSNDTFYYRLGQQVGEKKISEVAKSLGMGKTLGIDLPGEVAGIIPDNDWKVKNMGEIWYPGDTLHMSIGQGFILTTPLQIQNLTSSIAADGVQYPPHLALKITTPNGDLIKNFKYDQFLKSNYKKEDIDLIKEGLEEVTKDGGTAWPFFSFPIPTAGKTGTAEFGDPKDKTHAWYTAYAPVDDPKIAVTVLIEAGGEGSTNASPIAKEIFRWYFSPDKKNLIKDTNFIATESAKPLGE